MTRTTKAELQKNYDGLLKASLKQQAQIHELESVLEVTASHKLEALEDLRLLKCKDQLTSRHITDLETRNQVLENDLRYAHAKVKDLENMLDHYRAVIADIGKHIDYIDERGDHNAGPTH
jgi:chromosome segregation ATPase